jgi:hypothetical protein
MGGWIMRARLGVGITIALALLGAPLTASWAQAKVQVITKTGAWQVFGGTTDTGRPVCGISSTLPGSYFGLKYFSNDPTFTIQLGSSKWKIENGAKQKVVMRFDRRSPWSAVGTGMHFGDGDAGIEFNINRKQLPLFIREFRLSTQLRVEFPNGIRSSRSSIR